MSRKTSTYDLPRYEHHIERKNGLAALVLRTPPSLEFLGMFWLRFRTSSTFAILNEDYRRSWLDSYYAGLSSESPWEVHRSFGFCRRFGSFLRRGLAGLDAALQ